METAIQRGLPIIDLRASFFDDSDYANPIQVSYSGGEKISELIASCIKHTNWVPLPTGKAHSPPPATSFPVHEKNASFIIPGANISKESLGRAHIFAKLRPFAVEVRHPPIIEILVIIMGRWNTNLHANFIF
jgi:hypothetical protein